MLLFLWFLAGTLSISLILIGLSQFTFFRSWAASTTLNFVNNELEAKIELSDFTINPFSGIRLYDARLIAAGDTLAYVPEIFVDADLFELTDMKVIVHKLKLTKPRVKLLRNSRDSTWNFEHIARPSDDTTESEMPDWVFHLKNFVISSASLIITDSTVKGHSNDFDILHSEFTNFNLSLNALAKLKDLDFELGIEKLNFTEEHSEFDLNNFEFMAKIDRNRAVIESLKVKTPGSHFSMSAGMKSVNIFNIKSVDDLAGKESSLKLEIDSIGLEDVSKFYKVSSLLDNDIYLDLDITGSIDQINLNELTFDFASSHLELLGDISDVTETDKAQFNLNFLKTTLDVNELTGILPQEIAQYIPKIGDVFVNKLDLSGTYKKINSTLDISSRVGKVKGEANVEFGEDKFSYGADIEVIGGNLAPILANPEFISDLNTEIKVSGEGLSLDEMIVDLEMHVGKSYFSRYKCNDILMKASIKDKGIISIDTMGIALDPDDYLTEEYSWYENRPRMELKGELDYRNLRIPKYNLQASLHGVNVAAINNLTQLPQQVSCDLNVEGSGFHLDSLDFDLKTSVEECVFGDRAFIPFDFDVKVSREGKTHRDLEVKSSFFNLQLAGKYNFSNLINILTQQGELLADFSMQKVKSIELKKQNSELVLQKPSKKKERIKSFTPINLTLKADIFDLTPISAFLDDINLFCNSKVDLRYNVGRKTSSLILDTLKVNSFEMSSGDFRLRVEPISINSGFNTVLEDSTINVKNLSLGLKGENNIYINDLTITKPSVFLNFMSNSADFDLSAIINKDIQGSALGSAIFDPGNLNVILDKVECTYKDKLTWKNNKQIEANLNSKHIEIKQLSILREGAEQLTLSGTLNNEEFGDVNLNLKNLSLKGFDEIVDPETREALSVIQGGIKDLSLYINGKQSNPEIKANIKTTNLAYNRQTIGRLTGELNYLNKNISGEVRIDRNVKDSILKVLKADIRKVPLNLSFTEKGDMLITDREVDFDIETNYLPITGASPFVKDFVKNLRGFLNSRVKIGGYLPDKLTYYGNVSLNKASFLLVPNNLDYYADADIDLENEKILLNYLQLRNSAKDLASGKLDIYGEITLEDLNLKSIDMKCESKRFKVLGNASRMSLPFLYGDMIISTGKKPLYFNTDMKESNLGGHINVLKGNLKIPNTIQQKSIETKVIYEYNTIKISMDPDEKSNQGELKIEKTVSKKKASFLDQMEMDLDVTLKDPLSVDMELGSLLLLKLNLLAEIGQVDKSVPLKYFKARGKSSAQFLGDLEIREGSKLKLIKLFNAQGVVSFPDGDVSNPVFKIKSDYNGRSLRGGRYRDYIVKLNVKGTKDKPDIKLDYVIDNTPAYGDSTEIAENAIFLLLFGKTKNEMTGNSSEEKKTSGLEKSLQSLQSTAAQAAAAAVSAAFTGILSGEGMINIRSADIEMADFSMENARLHLSGQLFGLNVRLGGTMADLSNNYQLIVDVPLTTIDAIILNMQLSMAASPQTNVTQDQKRWEVKFKVGGSY